MPMVEIPGNHMFNPNGAMSREDCGMEMFARILPHPTGRHAIQQGGPRMAMKESLGRPSSTPEEHIPLEWRVSRAAAAVYLGFTWVEAYPGSARCGMC